MYTVSEKHVRVLVIDRRVASNARQRIRLKCSIYTECTRSVHQVRAVKNGLTDCQTLSSKQPKSTLTRTLHADRNNISFLALSSLCLVYMKCLHVKRHDTY